MRYLISLMAVFMLLTSCSEVSRIEKRRYRKGFYVGKANRKSEKDVIKEDLNPDYVISESEMLVAETVVANSDTVPLENNVVETNSIDDEIIVDRIDEKPNSDTAKKQNRIRNYFRYDGPPEAKRTTILHRIAIPLLILGFIGIVLMMIPGIGYFPFLIVFSYLFFIGAILEIIVLIKSAFAVTKYAGSPTITTQFAKLLRQAAIVALIIAGIYIAFVVYVIVRTLYVN
jgi:hypothetical protein